MTQTRVAIVDDDRLLLEAWTAALGDRYAVFAFRDGLEAERFFEKERVDVALIDLQMPGRDGVELLRAIKRLQPDTEVVIVTGHGSIANAVEATRAGALDFVTKPIEDPETIVLRIERVLERRRLAVDNAALRETVRAHGPETTLVGHSPPMQRLHEMIERISDSPAAVLIVGESGTGKELVARAIHARSGRRDRPFVPVNCAAIAETLIDNELFGHERGAFTGASTNHKGLFEAAHGGVLFLDEIGDVPPATQVRLLRVLQEGEVRPVGATASRAVDVRVVAATNVDLAKAMADGRFRSDLYFRLSTFELSLPPLRDRGDDVLALARRMLQRHALRTGTHERGIGSDAAALLASYAWPGNVRELGNVIEYAVTLCAGEALEPPHLPPKLFATRAAHVALDVFDDMAYRTARDRFERRYLSELLRTSNGNLSEAARRSGVDRSNLRRMMQRIGIDQHGATVARAVDDHDDD